MFVRCSTLNGMCRASAAHIWLVPESSTAKSGCLQEPGFHRVQVSRLFSTGPASAGAGAEKRLPSNANSIHVLEWPGNSNKSIRSETWQTLLFVRNQMDLTLSKVPSRFTTRREIEFPPMNAQGSLSAVAELHRTSLSATVRTARSVFRQPKQSIQQAPNRPGQCRCRASLSSQQC